MKTNPPICLLAKPDLIPKYIHLFIYAYEVVQGLCYMRLAAPSTCYYVCETINHYYVSVVEHEMVTKLIRTWYVYVSLGLLWLKISATRCSYQ